MFFCAILLNGYKSIVRYLAVITSRFRLWEQIIANTSLEQKMHLTKHPIEQCMVRKRNTCQKNALPRFERVAYAPDLYPILHLREKMMFSFAFFAHYSYCSLECNRFVGYPRFSTFSDIHFTVL